LNLMYKGKPKALKTKGMVKCEGGNVTSSLWIKMTPKGLQPADDCVNDKFLGSVTATLEEHAKLWRGECATYHHVNAFRKTVSTQYSKMAVTPALQAFAPSCIKALLNPVLDPCAPSAPAAQSPCAAVAPRLYAAEQESAVQKAAAGETSAAKRAWSLPFVGFFGMCVLVGVATMVYRRKARKETRQFRSVQPNEVENGLIAGNDSDEHFE